MVGRLTPKDIQDAAPYSNAQQPNMAAITYGQGSSGPGSTPAELNATLAKQLGQECYRASTDWINSGRRNKWSDSLRAFQSLHPNASKYLSGDYRYRSRLFRPKTRAMVRRSEAETAAAFFSNEDVVSITAQDDNDTQQLASAEINKRLVQYRLTKTIPWFLTLIGARQDADVMGICIAKPFWKYKEQFSHTETRPKFMPGTQVPMALDDGSPATEEFDIYTKAEDHPWIDLIAPENFRFDPAADWRDPVATSPYLIELIPMYVADVRAKIEDGDWLPVADSAIMGSQNIDDDSTRRVREHGRIPGKDNDNSRPRDFDIAWVRENVIRWKGKDWHFYSLSSSGELLSNPRPIEEVYLQGIRPYVVGFVIPEAHKTYPSGKVELMRDLQTQTNDVMNLRLDNVKLTLNPRQFVKAGSQADAQDLRIFNPGKVVLLKDPQTDVKWDRPPDATASSFEEQDRINADFDELAGGMSASSQQQAQQPLIGPSSGTTQILDGNASKMGEYELRVFTDTFVEKVIHHLVKLEQAYETDAVVLALAGKEAQLYQKFGINEITDQLLRQELTTKVNVGIGATNPQVQLKNFSTGAEILGKMFGPALAMGLKFEETVKEVMGKCGYRDGMRFFQPGFDPHQAMQQMMQAKKGGAPAAQQNDPGKVQAAQIGADSRMQEQQLKSETDLQVAQLDYQKTQLQEQMETHRAQIEAEREIATMPQPPHPLLAGMMGHRHG